MSFCDKAGRDRKSAGGFRLNIYLVVLVAYSLALGAAGIWLSRQVRGSADFLVAGRGLGPGLVFATFLAANIGAGSTVGAASLGYRIGWSAWWWVGSAGLGSLVLANLVAPKLWRLARQQNFHSLGDFLEWRYSRGVRVLIAAILWLGSLGLLAAQLIAVSLLFQVVVGVAPWIGAVLAGVLMTAYFTAGGLFSSARVNLLQLAVLLTGFVLAVPFSLQSCHGWSGVAAAVSASAPERYLSVFGVGAGGVLHYVALLAPSFVVSPGLVLKAYGSRSAVAARFGINLNAVALLLFAAIPPLFGIVARASFAVLPDPQLAMFRVMTDLLPTWLGVLALAAVFSAEVSTCDAVLSMLASTASVDLFKGYWKPTATDAELLRVSRLSSFISGALGIAVAVLAPSIIGALTVFYSLVSVALFVPVVCGLFSSRPDHYAALGAIGASVAATAALGLLPGNTLPNTIPPVAAGLLVSLVTLGLLTFLRRGPR